MSKKHDVPEVRGAIELVVARDPAYRDPVVQAGQGPRYVYHGEPNCLGALVLVELGFTVKQLKHLDKRGSIIVGAADFSKRFTHPAWELMKFIQVRNDWGRNWGRIADEAFNDKAWGDRVYHPNCSFWELHPWLEKPTGEALTYAQNYGVGALA